MTKQDILGVGVTNAKKEETLEFIVTSLPAGRQVSRDSGKNLSIFTPNPEIIMHAKSDDSFKKIINSADLALADGVGVMLAGRLMGKPFKERITGVDFMLDLCEAAAKEGFTIGLLGGGFKIAERTAECLLRKYPSLKIVFAGEEWLEKDDRRWKIENPSSTLNHLSSSIDILFVALGFPKQEKWIADNLDRIPVRVAMAVGGSFDYISGEVPRAPLFIRQIGLEWLFRLIFQPWRIRRQLSLVKFLFLVLKEKFSSKQR